MSEWESWWGDEEASQWDGSSPGTDEEIGVPGGHLPGTLEFLSRRGENSAEVFTKRGQA